MSNCSTCPSAGTCSVGGKDEDGLPPGMLQCYDLNESTADGNLVWIEAVRDGDGLAIAPAAAEVLSRLRGYDGRLFGAVIGGNELKDLYSDAFSHGVNTLYHVRGSTLNEYRPEAFCDALADVVNRINPAGIVFGGTARGREIAPRLAATLAAGLVTGCTDVAVRGRELLLTRPSQGGRLLTEAVCSTFPQMAVVRPGALPAPRPEEGRRGTVIYRQYECAEPGDPFTEEAVMRDGPEKAVLVGSELDRESVGLAERIAAGIGGAAVCTCAVAARGWMPADAVAGSSVRDTGPRICLAFGLADGEAHAITACDAGRTVAVVPDRGAAAAQLAHEAVIGDAAAVLAAMAGRLGV